MIHLLHLHSVPIYRQLQLEEALLRADERNFCIINTNSPSAIVMGISGKADQLIDLSLTKQDKVPIIKRFSGGGTVFVDEETVFVSFIGNDADFPFKPYPQEILEWSEGIYRPLFANHPFHLRENDYVIGEKKVGGNAQYLRKGRWLLHTSFLWSYSETKMQYLLLPEKRPNYRQSRSHADFLTTLSSHFTSKKEWISDLKTHIMANFTVNEVFLPELNEVLSRTHRQATCYEVL